MKYNSLTFKLMVLSLGSFISYLVISIYLADYELRKIVDNSQNEMYEQKVAIIHNIIARENEKLQKTGLVEAYREDFQNAIIEELRDNYYGDSSASIYPFIFSSDMKMVMHPNLQSGVIEKRIIEVFKSEIDFRNKNLVDYSEENIVFKEDEGHFYSSFQDQTKWYIYKRFEKWDWIVVFAVPTEIKYQSVTEFKNKIVIIDIVLFTFVIGIVLLLISKITKPIQVLKDAASNIAHGKMNQKIDISSNDEFGELAKSFEFMQNSIKINLNVLSEEIVERKAAENRSLYFKNYFFNIINSMPSTIVVVDNDCKITHWNRAAEECFEIKNLDAVGKYILDIIPRLVTDIDAITTAIINKKEIFIEKCNFIENGKLSYENRIIYPISSSDVEGAVLRIDDITTQVEIEQQLQQSQKMDAIGQLAGGIAHDFNNMLGGIIGATQLLDMPNRNLDEQSKLYVSLIEKAATRAADLTNQLLMFSRKKHEKLHSINVEDTIKESLNLLERSLDKQIVIRTELRAVEKFVMGDESQLQNIIMNICINASHAIGGKGTIKIETSNRVLDELYCNASVFDICTGNYFEIVISDNGCGIEKANLKKIFEPFFTTKEQGKGTGLGLSAVYGVVETYHGEIIVESELEKGTIFTILIPITTVNQSKEKYDTLLSKGVGLILLVDDEEILRETVKDMLKEMGYDVITASNGKEAIEKYHSMRNEINLVLLDMIMPEMNGKEVFKQLKDIDPAVNVVLSSGYSKSKDYEQMQKDGLLGYIKKPYKFDELNRVLKEVLV